MTLNRDIYTLSKYTLNFNIPLYCHTQHSKLYSIARKLMFDYKNYYELSPSMVGLAKAYSTLSFAYFKLSKSKWSF